MHTVPYCVTKQHQARVAHIFILQTSPTSVNLINHPQLSSIHSLIHPLSLLKQNITYLLSVDERASVHGIDAWNHFNQYLRVCVKNSRQISSQITGQLKF